MRNPDPLRDFDAFDPAMLDPTRRARKLDGRRQLTPGSKVVVLGGIGNSFVAKYGSSGLISYWKLDEASGDRADSFGSNTLTDNNTVTQAAGKLGNAGQFTAANNEFLSIADNASISTGNIDFTICAWVYLDDKTALHAVVVKADDTNDGTMEYSLIYSNTADRFRFIVGDGVSLLLVDADAFGSPSTATWYFLVASHEAATSTLSIQVNDGTASTAAIGGDPQDAGSSFRIGAYGGPFGPMNGRIDSVSFWKRLFTAAEKTYLYNNGNGRPIIGSE